ncbi:hypothetical protein Tco_0789101 [Tanacetum coccineum]
MVVLGISGTSRVVLWARFLVYDFERILFQQLVAFKRLRCSAIMLRLLRSRLRFRRCQTVFYVLVGISRGMWINYPSFRDENDEVMDLSAFINVADPTLVKVVERERVEGEAKLLETTVGRTVPLLPVALVRSEASLEDSVNRLFDEGGSGNQVDSAIEETCNASGFNIPKKLREDYGTSGGHASGGKSPSVIRKLLASSILNAEVGVAAIPTLPFVTSSVSATPEKDGDDFTDAVTGPNLRTIGPSAVVTTEAAGVSSHLFPKTVVDTSSRFGPDLFLDSDSADTERPVTASTTQRPGKELSMGSREVDSEALHETFVPRWNVPNDTLLDEHDISREFIDHLAPPVLFSQIRNMDYHHLFTEFNVGTARQACLNAEVNVLEGACSELREQVFAYESLKEQIEEFQDEQMRVIWLLTHGLKLFITKCLNSSEYLVALGAAISRATEKGMQVGLAAGIEHGKQGRGLEELVAYNPSAEEDYNTTLRELRAVEFSLLADLKSNKDASTEAVMNLLRLSDPLANLPGMSDLQPDVEQLMVPIHRLEDQVVLGASSLTFSLSVSHDRVEQIRRNIAEHRSALAGVFAPLAEPFSVQSLIGAANTSDAAPSAAATTTALSTTFASANTILPVSVDDYVVADVVNEENVQPNVEYKGEGSAAADINFEKEKLDTTP